MKPCFWSPYLHRLILAAVAVCCAVLAKAQTEAADSLDLPEAVVIANRSPVPLERVGHTFDVITKRELESLPINSTAEALQFVGGLDLRQRGPNGVQADLSIRGGTFDQALVLVNGIKLADPQTGHHLLNIPVPLENIERIEILKGPGARLYGHNAFAGAVNIITKVEESAATTLRAELGQFGVGGFGASLSLPYKQLRQTLSYQRDFAQGYEASGTEELRDNTDYTIVNSLYQAQLRQGAHSFGLLAGLSERAFGANGFYASASATQQFEAVQTSLVALTHASGDFSQRLSWRRNQDEYVFVRSNPSLYRNLHISQVYGYDAYKSFDHRLGRLGLGGEVQAVTLASNNLGNRERRVLNLVAEQQFELLNEQVRITPGLTFNYLSDAGARLLPGLDVHYQHNEQLSLYGNSGLTYRIPTYTDLYYADQYNEGNPDLVAERTMAYEVGARYEKGGLEARASLWHRDAIDLIDFVRTSAADTVWQPQNITDATFSGVEVQLTSRRVAPWLPLARVSYNYIDAELPEQEGEFISRYALDNLRHQMTAVAMVRLAQPLHATLTYRLADRVSEPAPDAAPLDYQLLDVRVEYRYRQATLFAMATNVLDERYAQANGVELPGRWLRTGLRVRLD